MRALEKQLERAGSRTFATAMQAADRSGEAVATALNEFQATGFTAARARSETEAIKFGNEAVHLGDVALRRLADEVEHRPLVTLAVAVGVGLLVGFALQRR